MALSKVDYNSLNVTAVASKALKWNSTPNGFETGDVGGSLVLLETKTASSDSTLSFTSNIDSTYKEYIFKFYDMHPETDAVEFEFQADTGTNTSYNLTITSSTFSAYHTEADDSATFSYAGGRDIAQGTTFQTLTHGLDNDNDSCCAGTLQIFEPSSTTFAKHFFSDVNVYNADGSQRCLHAGYFNTTTAITRFRFKMNSGNVDAGTIKMYGVV